MASQPDIYAHWRDSALTPVFFSVDARCSFIILLCLVRPSWYTFGMVVVSLGFLSILNYYHVSLIAAVRIIRNFVTGSTKIIIRRK
jgi:hypothetical protein